ncbi:MAG: hypothetical protein V4733_07165 [Verrucomicrobiota bacterium]
MPYSQIATLPLLEDFDELLPPKGVRIVNSMRGREIRYKRISPSVFFLIPFTAAWSGFSMTGIYGSQIEAGKFNPGLSLFGLPFLCGTIFLLSLIVFMLFGRSIIDWNEGQLRVKAGVGPLGWTRRISCGKDARVSIRMAKWRQDNQPVEQIVIEDDGKALKFGGGFPHETKRWIAEAVKRQIRAGGVW